MALLEAAYFTSILEKQINNCRLSWILKDAKV